MKPMTATGAVITSVRVGISGNNKSFHANRKHKMAVAERPGVESGSWMGQKACAPVAASIRATSYSALGS